MKRANPNSWRYKLNPADPDYLEPPTADEVDAQEEIQEWAPECDLMDSEGYQE